MRLQILISLSLLNFWSWILSLGGPGLILLGVLDNSVIPLPGSMDAMVILLASYQRHLWAYYGFMAAVGAVLGGFLTFRLGEKSEEKVLEKRIGKKRAEKVYRAFRKRGFSTIVISSIMPPPFPMSPVLVAAGALHYPRKKFFVSLSIGRSIRFLGVAYLGHVYGKAIISSLSQYYKPLLYTLIGLAVLAGIGALVYFKWYRPKRQREERERGEPVEGFPIPHHKAGSTDRHDDNQEEKRGPAR
ncbi:MAG: YqaA family protein [Candidatus Acidiferrales bacterium]